MGDRVSRAPRTESPVAVVGSGPNGLAAAVTIARAGIPVTVFESATTLGGGARTSELIVDGALHDVCSAVHPTAFVSEFFRQFELEKRVEFVVPEVSYAHPLWDGRVGLAYRDIRRTADTLGADGPAYTRLFEPLLSRLSGIADLSLGGGLLRMPRDPLAAAALGVRVVEQGTSMWNARFSGDVAPAMLTGVAAHSAAALPGLASAAVGMVLASYAHGRGWPMPVGGSQKIADAMADDLIAYGGQTELQTEISDVAQLDDFGVKIFATSAASLASITADVMPERYSRRLRGFRYGRGVCKVDFVLSGPIPWQDERIALSPTVHIGGSRREIAHSEAEVSWGRHSPNPYVLLTQPSLFDSSRAPGNLQTVWTYVHVPNGSTRDCTADVIHQIEGLAPGFRELIVGSRATPASQLAAYNANYVGGDIGAGAISMRQLIQRPTATVTPWRTPLSGVYLASSSTPPGTGVHGMSGWLAAKTALRDVFHLPAPDLGLTTAVPA